MNVLKAFFLAALLLAAPAEAWAEPGPESVLVEGKPYLRLRSDELKAIVVGHQIWAAVQRSPHHVVIFFGKQGDYESYAGRDPLDSGKYVIENDAVQVRVPGDEAITRLLYRASDGELIMATHNTLGEVRWTKVSAKPL
jgi:hypothetical protein